jgi:hypothetical protein
LTIRARGEDASFEIDLENPERLIRAGDSEAVETITSAGVQLWPK